MVLPGEHNPAPAASHAPALYTTTCNNPHADMCEVLELPSLPTFPIRLGNEPPPSLGATYRPRSDLCIRRVKHHGYQPSVDISAYAYSALVELQRAPLMTICLQNAGFSSRPFTPDGRRGPTAQVGGPASPPPRRIYFASWNINFIWGKRQDVAPFLTTTRHDILALQETRRTAEQYPIQVRGYRVIERCDDFTQDELAQGHRGLAMLVRAPLTAFSIPCAFSRAQGVLVQLPTDASAIRGVGARSLLIVNCYLTARAGQQHTREREELLTTTAALIRQHRPRAAAIVGDLSEPPDRVERWARRAGLERLATNGWAITFHAATDRRAGTTPDHILVMAGTTDRRTTPHAYWRRTRVHRGWDSSDHWPLSAALTIPGGAELTLVDEPARLTAIRRLPDATRTRILALNHWAPLSEMASDPNASPEAMARQLAAAYQAATALLPPTRAPPVWRPTQFHPLLEPPYENGNTRSGHYGLERSP
ncbi:hypothetical protein CXG81DRAFT_21434 [Caulochytrium protostelioides]|uniref:Endonuclease/exonuclease/phosphatase domain-containing protein n=1 Tax=Caulochytrium protostelioides TaxID=1555241 RepID=A0A4P9X2F7_9FUNG|nr:hypothetical protein CXG81DRAFT_21434 [Caulochytrium protostelioides]|eukprot:RKO98316.1 hypothetical protein CXG81DRAFT_21434 [Caulochytrium protostelioides]